ncbi:MAG: hypothetical protein WAN35_08735 [Terracidiphilus sp.]
MNAPIQPAMPYPMTFGQILDRIYRLMRSQFKLFLSIASLPMAAFILLYALFFAIIFIPIISHMPAQPDLSEIFKIFPMAFLILTPLFLAVFSFYLTASIHAALQAHQGVSVTFRESYQVAWQGFGRSFWLLTLCYLIAFLPMLLIELPLFACMKLIAVQDAAPAPALFFLLPLGILLLFAAMVYGLIIAMRLSLAFPASLAEGLTAREAIRRSGQLTKGAKGRIFLVLLVIYALGYAAEMAGFLVLAAIIGVGALIMMAFHVTLLSVAGIAGVVLGVLCILAFLFLWIALFWAAFSTAFAVLYHDQRLRKEGPPTAPAGSEVSQA